MNNRTGFYRVSHAFDPSGYINQCKYRGKELKQYNLDFLSDCPIFEPVVTDLGICYAFNAGDTRTLLKPSAFKTAFSNAYESDFSPENRKLQMGLGAGPDVALKFTLDNNGLYRSHVKPFSFKVGCKSRPHELFRKATNEFL